SGTLARHLAGLAVWDAADDRAHRAAHTTLTGVLPDLARRRYEELVRRLAVDVPEFAVWMTLTEARAASRGLERLEALLRRAVPDRDPGRLRAGLTAVYRGELDEPILGGDAGDLVMPSLGRAYLDPWFRARSGGPGTRPADEAWWNETGVRSDFDAFLAAHLTSPQAAKVPLLLLGQPGGGKSSLTRILAARLPAADFLVVRVVLREVRAESAVQDQIEQALRGTLGESVTWPELTDSAQGAMPVILLDGLDELLQATGVHQSGYLEQVARFQQREAFLNRPVAVIVTSRVAVADRARLPAGGIVVRLEPFVPSQVDRWLEVWTAANAGYWERTGRRPLTGDVLGRFPALAAQPLLLLMLALYDAGTNALQGAEEFDTGQLYERLLRDFAGREVRRVHGENLTESDRAGLIDEELLRLSVVAFAMFHRLRLWATAAELDADLTGLGLTGLGPQPSGTARDAGFQRPFTAGEEMVGRFFFIQRTQAFQDDQTLRSYEFLHATFGEYLVARLVVQAVREAYELSRVRSLRLGRRDDDDLLRSLLGYTPLCARSTVLPFVTSLLAREEPPELREWLIEQLRVAVTRPTWSPLSYRPIDKRVDHWMATYSFNLLLIALACGGPVRASELFRQARDPAGWLRDTVLQWRGAVPGGMWLEGLKSLQVTRTWAADERRDMVLESTEDPRAEPIDPLWSHRYGPRWYFPDNGIVDDFSSNFPLVPALTSMTMSGSFSDDVVRHAVDPIMEHLSWSAMTTFVDHGPRPAESIARSIIGLLLADRGGDVPLSDLYQSAAEALDGWAEDGNWTFENCFDLFLRSLAADAHRLAPADVLRWVAREITLGRQVALILECLALARRGADDHYDGFAADRVADLGHLIAYVTPEACLRLLTVLPVTGRWRMSTALDAIRARLRDAGPDFVARAEPLWTRFEGYRDE
ncbi:MAG TPA: AAA family ATPase, partial [Actinoplanes sp.]|nr:AAA family ATPase [Actinoplanes sp.]